MSDVVFAQEYQEGRGCAEAAGLGLLLLLEVVLIFMLLAAVLSGDALGICLLLPACLALGLPCWRAWSGARAGFIHSLTVSTAGISLVTWRLDSTGHVVRFEYLFDFSTVVIEIEDPHDSGGFTRLRTNRDVQIVPGVLLPTRARAIAFGEACRSASRSRVVIKGLDELKRNTGGG